MTIVSCLLVLQGGFVDFPDEQILLLLPDSCDIISSLGEFSNWKLCQTSRFGLI